ncbi:hypothetical protein BGX28_005501 [Mortierella sp. GBA30]|nr:hypothetical protein BGX28_005501 [Mortierella sp. GBA30]
MTTQPSMSNRNATATSEIIEVSTTSSRPVLATGANSKRLSNATSSSPSTTTVANTKRLSNATSRGTARRIVYSVDLEQGLPEGSIARESHFEIVPSNRVSISSRTTSSITASSRMQGTMATSKDLDELDGWIPPDLCNQPSTVVVQSNKRGVGKILSALQPKKSNTNGKVDSDSVLGKESAPGAGNSGTISDSDDEWDATRYKAKILKKAAEDAANIAETAAAKALAAAKEVAETRAAKLKLRQEGSSLTMVDNGNIPVDRAGSSDDNAGK